MHAFSAYFTKIKTNCVFERLFKILKNGLFLFGIFFKDIEILNGNDYSFTSICHIYCINYLSELLSHERMLGNPSAIEGQTANMNSRTDESQNKPNDTHSVVLWKLSWP